MDMTIRTIVEYGVKVLVTYPNNDDGSESIIQVIKKWENNLLVIVRKNLGSAFYYTACDNSMFVVGNSSSGIIEIPYFQKYTLNVGERQSGRNFPKSVINVPNDYEQIYPILQGLLDNPVCTLKQEYIYGNGDSVLKIKQIIKTNNKNNFEKS